jgi:hypothetical protein
MKMRGMAAALALALGTIVAGSANATVYLLTSGHFGPGNYGQVTVTGDSTDLHFVLQLAPAYSTVDTGQHFSFSGNVGGTFTAAGIVLDPSQTGDFTVATGTNISNAPFNNDFDFDLSCTAGCGNGGSNPFNGNLTFDIIGSNLSVLPATTDTSIFFAADVSGPNGTGVVGGGPLGVPEPMTWGLMIAGLGMVGAALRQRRALILA